MSYLSRPGFRGYDICVGMTSQTMTLEGVDCTRVQEIEATPAGKMEELSVAPIERISYTYKQVSLLSEDRYPRQISLRSLLVLIVGTSSLHVFILHQMCQADFLRLRVEFARFAPNQCVPKGIRIVDVAWYGKRHVLEM
jgi:hypothetical protein